MSREVAVGVAIGVATPILYLIVRAVTKWFARTISRQVVDAIGDSLQVRWRADIDAALDDALASINAELKTNKGSSLKDHVAAISLRLSNIEAQVVRQVEEGR
jgi:hypothetical protein